MKNSIIKYKGKKTKEYGNAILDKLFVISFVAMVCSIVWYCVGMTSEQAYHIALEEVEKSIANYFPSDIQNFTLDVNDTSMITSLRNNENDVLQRSFGKEYLVGIAFYYEGEKHVISCMVTGKRSSPHCVIRGIDGVATSEWASELKKSMNQQQVMVAPKAVGNAAGVVEYSDETENIDEVVEYTVEPVRDDNRTSNKKENVQYEDDIITEMILKSDSVCLADEYDLYEFTASDLRLIRNGIYARHGYIFEDEKLLEYYSEQSYYTPTVKKSEWKESVLNDTELANVQDILSVEEILNSTQSVADENEEKNGLNLKKVFKKIMKKYQERLENDEEEGFVFMEYQDSLDNGLSIEYEGLDKETGDEVYAVEVPATYYVYCNNYECSVFVHFTVYYSDGEYSISMDYYYDA